MTLTLYPVPAHGCEDVAVAGHGLDAGCVFTGTEDGSIWRVRPDGLRTDRVAHTAGRPLGIEVDADGTLVVCDATRGLLRVDPATGAVEVLVDQVGAHPMLVCNNAAIASDGTIWFSDSSTRYRLDRWKDDFLQVTSTGRLLRRGPDGEVEVVTGDLAFANGVALAADESFVVVAESSRRTLVRWWIAGDRAGTRDLLVAELPGYPDNIARGSDGLIWVALGSPRDPLVELLMRAPAPVQKLAAKLPPALQPGPRKGLWAQAYDETGRLVHDVRIDTDAFHMTTGVREHDGTLWAGSLEEAGIASVAL
ncbi:MAG TPA: SMP-30/gluconolactonase/LRE family protein [Nocardioides sp.]|nr:SMP-30/gluconolactonase/LRE family protein [Nocardioides sp.]